MPMKEFRRMVSSTLPLPVIVTSDGADTFAVINFAMLQDLVQRAKAVRDPCPYCGKAVAAQRS